MDSFSNEGALKSLIQRHQRKVFPFIFYCVGCNLDQAYEVCVSSFADAIRRGPPASEENFLLREVLRLAIGKGRETRTILSSPDDTFAGSAVRKEVNKTVRRSLLTLPFEDKVVLLLRDQLNLPYEEIASILERSEGTVRSNLIRARIALRKRIEETVEGPEPPS